MAPLPLPPDLQALLERYHANRAAALDAEVALLAARTRVTLADRRAAALEAEAAAGAYGHAADRAEAAERAVVTSARALAEALLAHHVQTEP